MHKRPSFGQNSSSKAEYCFQHKPIDSIDVRHKMSIS